ncbi:MAG TPA: hypothetical protein PKJ19_09495 [Flavobacteriales bacterium]|nr:hypothetical protein [Flavobacteriales bacterium]
MSTAPTYTGTAHGEVSNGYSWDDHAKQWVDVTHLVQTDKAAIQNEVTSSLQRLGVTDEVISRLMERAREVDKEIVTPEDFAEAAKALREIRKVTSVGEHNVDLIHSHYIELWKTSGDIKKQTLARLAEPKEIVSRRINAYKRKQEEAEEKERQRVQMLMEQRQRDVMDLGFVQLGGQWTLEGLSVDAQQVMTIDHEGWKNLYASMRMHSEGVMADRAEKERIAKEEAERIEREKAELAERERVLAEREAKMRADLAASRINELLAMGCTINGGSLLVSSPIATHFSIDVSDVADPTDEEWIHVLEDAKNAVDAAKEATIKYEAEQERKRKEANERALAAAREAMEREAREAEERKKREQEERIARDGDVELLRQAEIIITSAGSKVGELLTKAKSSDGAACIASVRETLLSAHRIIKATQDVVRQGRNEEEAAVGATQV